MKIVIVDDDKQEDLYLWMHHLEETGEPEYVRTAPR